MKKTLKYISVIFVLAAATAIMTGCSGSKKNSIYQNADPVNSALAFYTYDGTETRWKWLYDDNQKKELLGKLSQGEAVPVADWVPSEKDLPFYGIVIGTKEDQNGRTNELEAVYCGNHLILNDGTVYEIKTDIEKLTTGYSWQTEDSGKGIHVPCQKFLATGTSGWNTTFLNEDSSFLPAQNVITESLTLDKENKIISMTFKNDGSEDFFFGKHFNLDVLIDGKWYIVPPEESMAFIDIGIILQAGEEQTEQYYIAAYGELPPGQYRLVNYGITGEFVIE